MLRAFLSLLIVLVLAPSAGAGQKKSASVPAPAVAAPTPATPAAQAPALTELEVAYVQIVNLTAGLAQCQAAQLDSTKQFNDVRADATARIEKAHPGFTVDWATNKLVPVPPK